MKVYYDDHGQYVEDFHYVLNSTNNPNFGIDNSGNIKINNIQNDFGSWM